MTLIKGITRYLELAERGMKKMKGKGLQNDYNHKHDKNLGK